MLVRTVTAHAFGPFAGDRLDLADGMTVVHGPNESGKSTWHAAVYLALCGRRRGRGRAGPDWQRLAERHRPWDRDEWLVSAEVVLDDGRRVEFRQDLDGRVDCHARDLVLGTDLSAEFMNDGTPDAARWLGLPPSAGSHFLLDPATVSALSHYRGIRAVKCWNAPLAFYP